MKTKNVPFHPETWRRLKELYGSECRAYYADCGVDMQLTEFTGVDQGRPSWAGVIDGSLCVLMPSSWKDITIVYPMKTKIVPFDKNIKDSVAVYYAYVGGRDKVYDYYFFKNGVLMVMLEDKQATKKCGGEMKFMLYPGLSTANLVMEVEI